MFVGELTNGPAGRAASYRQARWTYLYVRKEKICAENTGTLRMKLKDLPHIHTKIMIYLSPHRAHAYRTTILERNLLVKSKFSNVKEHPKSQLWAKKVAFS
jgi:hypothetical protein